MTFVVVVVVVVVGVVVVPVGVAISSYEQAACRSNSSNAQL